MPCRPVLRDVRPDHPPKTLRACGMRTAAQENELKLVGMTALALRDGAESNSAPGDLLPKCGKSASAHHH
jgi:hypothetical protein